jgi:hypothetical protein
MVSRREKEFEIHGKMDFVKNSTDFNFIRAE